MVDLMWWHHKFQLLPEASTEAYIWSLWTSSGLQFELDTDSRLGLCAGVPVSSAHV